MIAVIALAAPAAAEDGGIWEIQKKLNELGYEPGPPDGAWGRKTSAAAEQNA